jgi:hypothetical protein
MAADKNRWPSDSTVRRGPIHASGFVLRVVAPVRPKNRGRGYASASPCRTGPPEGKDNHVKIALKQEYSKTLGRTISLYWRQSLDAVREYLQERIAQGIKSQEPVFAGTYDSMKMFLARPKTRALKRHVYAHLFRHSSATYYAAKLNRQELCYRYGWKFSSNMPDVYISRAGMESKELDEKFTQTELGTLKDALAKSEQEDKIQKDRIQKLQKAIEVMQNNFQAVAKVVKANPPLAEVEARLRSKAPA